ncbi:hypothetical protein [Nocardiopsis alba]|uniref:hypothetical protein n=1 Tax=Nocardiopsis alba TaxID=53437 RepID=UPI0033FFAA39
MTGLVVVAVAVALGRLRVPVRDGWACLPRCAGDVDVVLALGGVNLVVGGRVRRACVGIMLTVCSLLLVREVRSGP